MLINSKLESFIDYLKSQFSFLNLEKQKPFEQSKDIVSYSANRIMTSPKKNLFYFFLLGIIVFCIVFSTLLFLFKPLREASDLRITKDDFVGLTEEPSKEDIKFELKIPTAVKWNNEYYYFDKPNDKGFYDIRLNNKQGVQKLYFYAYKGSWFDKSISVKPVLVVKEFDYSTPSVKNLIIEDSYSVKNPTWSFESDESSPVVTLSINGQESNIYDPNKTFAENVCKQEKVENNVKYNCVLPIAKEEKYNISAWMVDKVNNRVEILTNKVVAYIEPLKVDCSSPPLKVRVASVNIKCKASSNTTYTINGGTIETIEKDKEKIIPLMLDSINEGVKEYNYTVSFADPNGKPKDFVYKIIKDNDAPTLNFVPTVSKVGAMYSLTNVVKNGVEPANVEVIYDQVSSQNNNWYYKYPGNRSFAMGSNESINISNSSSDFKLCAKDPITNSETCVPAYTPSLVGYTYKVSDDVGNQSTYSCNYELSAAPVARCVKF